LATGLHGLTTSETTKINCYPNPFSDEVTIEINLSADAQVQVEVLNQLGQQVNVITSERMLNSGTHRLKWNGKNSVAQQVSVGIYFMRVVING